MDLVFNEVNDLKLIIEVDPLCICIVRIAAVVIRSLPSVKMYYSKLHSVELLFINKIENICIADPSQTTRLLQRRHKIVSFDFRAFG